MDPNNILTTAAQIAIALAGFSGIAVAISTRHAGEWRELERLLLGSLLLASAATFAFSFVPLLMSSAQLSPAAIWSLSSGLHAAWLLGVLALRIKQARSMTRQTGMFLNVIPAGTATLLQATNAVWLQAAWPYLTAIVLTLLAAFLIFAALLRSLGSAR